MITHNRRNFIIVFFLRLPKIFIAPPIRQKHPILLLATYPSVEPAASRLNLVAGDLFVESFVGVSGRQVDAFKEPPLLDHYLRLRIGAEVPFIMDPQSYILEDGRGAVVGDVVAREGEGRYEGCGGEENGCGEGGRLHCDGGRCVRYQDTGNCPGLYTARQHRARILR